MATAAIVAQMAIATISQISGKPCPLPDVRWPLPDACLGGGAAVVGVGGAGAAALDVGAVAVGVVAVGGVAVGVLAAGGVAVGVLAAGGVAVAVGVGVVPVGVVPVGVSGNAWVSAGGA